MDSDTGAIISHIYMPVQCLSARASVCMTGILRLLGQGRGRAELSWQSSAYYSHWQAASLINLIGTVTSSGSGSSSDISGSHDGSEGASFFLSLSTGTTLSTGPQRHQRSHSLKVLLSPSDSVGLELGLSP